MRRLCLMLLCCTLVLMLCACAGEPTATLPPFSPPTSSTTADSAASSTSQPLQEKLKMVDLRIVSIENQFAIAIDVNDPKVLWEVKYNWDHTFKERMYITVSYLPSTLTEQEPRDGYATVNRITAKLVAPTLTVGDIDIPTDDNLNGSVGGDLLNPLP